LSLVTPIVTEDATSILDVEVTRGASAFREGDGVIGSMDGDPSTTTLDA
jgi:hypothetical protein